MMFMLTKLKALSPSQRALLVAAMVALAVAALAIAIVPFRQIAAYASRRPARRAPARDDWARIVGEVRWAVQACARRAPWRAKCFEQSLAALWLLRRRGITATLHYGVAQRAGQGLAAHVWVRAGADDIDGYESSSEFTELARFPAAEAQAVHPCSGDPLAADLRLGATKLIQGRTRLTGLSGRVRASLTQTN